MCFLREQILILIGCRLVVAYQQAKGLYNVICRCESSFCGQEVKYSLGVYVIW